MLAADPSPPGEGEARVILNGELTSAQRLAPLAGESLISTSDTAFTRLLASTKLPSRVTEVLRTMLPPPGMTQAWNFSVLGSKRTTVFGLVPDSLYQMTSLIADMP